MCSPPWTDRARIGGDPSHCPRRDIRDRRSRYPRRDQADDGKFLTGRVARPESERLPPGQHRVKDWPVLDLGLQPEIALSNWTLDIDGLVDRPLHWRWDDLMAQEPATEVSDIHCVTTWSR